MPAGPPIKDNDHQTSAEHKDGPGVQQEKSQTYASFAVKVIRNKAKKEPGEEETMSDITMWSRSDVETAINEARLVMGLRHKHIVCMFPFHITTVLMKINNVSVWEKIKCYGAFENDSHLVFFYELGEGGDVQNRLDKVGKLPEEEALGIILCVSPFACRE